MRRCGVVQVYGCPVVIIDLTVAAGRHLRRNKWPGPGAQRGREPEPRAALAWVLALDASARLQLCISQLFGSSVSLFDPTRAHREPSQEPGPGVRLHLLDWREVKSTVYSGYWLVSTDGCLLFS